jgi:hypothetical protein
MEEEYKDILGDQYCFTDQLDLLGQRKGEDSHIAIVHIDGNEMGKRFREMESLAATRELSIEVAGATKNSVKKVLEVLVSNFEKIQEELGFDSPEKIREFPRGDDGKKIVPFVPVIVGGDDVTFVCNGKLGIYLAKTFLESFGMSPVKGENISACAGIAVTRARYPFSRGYELADQLCANAKAVRNQDEHKGAWLDFHIAYGGFSGTVGEIRESRYRAEQGNLLFRPFVLDMEHERGFEKFLEKSGEFKVNIPKSKRMRLREVLSLGKESAEMFCQELKARGTFLPEFTGVFYHENIWYSEKTPYFDMIELLEFYPSFGLEKKEKEENEELQDKD